MIYAYVDVISYYNINLNEQLLNHELLFAQFAEYNIQNNLDYDHPLVQMQQQFQLKVISV